MQGQAQRTPLGREAMLQDKEDRTLSRHAGVPGWTLRAITVRHCSLHSPECPFSSSREPPDLLEEGAYEGNGLHAWRGPPSPWAGVGLLRGWREQGQRQGRAGGGGSSLGRVMPGAAALQGHPTLDHTGTPKQGCSRRHSRPPQHPAKLSKGGSPPALGTPPRTIRHLKSSTPCTEVPYASRTPNPARGGGGGNPMHHVPQTQYWGVP